MYPKLWFLNCLYTPIIFWCTLIDFKFTGIILLYHNSFNVSSVIYKHYFLFMLMYPKLFYCTQSYFKYICIPRNYFDFSLIFFLFSIYRFWKLWACYICLCCTIFLHGYTSLSGTRSQYRHTKGTSFIYMNASAILTSYLNRYHVTNLFSFILQYYLLSFRKKKFSPPLPFLFMFY